MILQQNVTMYDSRVRPQSPGSVSWFEFLLNPSLLERHLSQENPDPPPTELIISFLSNCTNGDQPSNGMKSQPLIGPVYMPEENSPEIPELLDIKETKKNQALKLLALKVAAFLKWDVNLLEKKLPLTMQKTLLTVLLKICGNEVKSNGVIFSNGADYSKDAAFARVLYYTWVLRAVVEGSYPSKGQRGANVQIPGQIDPTYVPPNVVESIMRKLQEETDTATEALEEYILHPTFVRMPLLSCFGSITDECAVPIHKWEHGMILKEEEIVCQVSYALGRFYFFQEKYESASKHFITASDMFPKFQGSLFCQINESKLKGFYSACAHLLGYQKSEATTPLKDKLHISTKSGNQETVQILRHDNVKRELPLSIRDFTEISILQQHPSETDLLLYVTFCNTIRRTIDGEVVLSDWHSLLKANEEKSSLIMCELLKEVIPICTLLQKSYLKNFVQSLCLVCVPARVLLRKFEVLNMLMPLKEVEEVLNYGQQISKRETLKLDKSFTEDLSVQVGLLERKLLSAADANTVRLVVAQLRGAFQMTNICALNKKWKLKNKPSIFLKGVPPHVDIELIQILISKAEELCKIKNFADARHLYRSVENEIRNYSPRLSRYINGELLRQDLLEILDSPVYVCQPSTYRTEVIQKILSFLSCFKERVLTGCICCL